MELTKQELENIMKAIKPSVEREQTDKVASDVLTKIEKKMEDLFNNYANKQQVTKSTTYEYDIDEFKADDPRTQLYKALYLPAEDEVTKRFQLQNDKILIASALMKVHPSRLSTFRRFREGRTELAKAMANVTGAGAEWVPEAFSSSFIERMEGEYRVAGLIPTIPISNKAGTLKVPAADTAASMYLISGATDEDDVDKIPGTTPGTRVITIEPEKLGARIVLDADLQEDAIMDMTEYIRKELYTSAARGLDDVCINGDTSATHQDSDVTASNDHRKAWSGFRKLTPSSAQVDSSDSLTIATFRQTWVKMSTSTAEYGMPENCTIFVNQLGFARLMTLSEVLTIDKYGANATIVKGELGSLFGIPIIPTSLVRRNLNASGVYDGTTTTYTKLILANKDAFLMGTKRAAKVKSQEDIDYDRTKFVITLRQKMVPTYESTEPICAYLYGLSVNT